MMTITLLINEKILYVKLLLEFQ